MYEFSGEPIDIDHYPMVAKVIERLAISKKVA
jgi:hypothetical protein